jgi:purine-cytosine permease-like protein
MILIWYVLLICMAVMGVIALAAFYVAMWIVAIIAALVIYAARFASGQRGEQLWRKPFSPRIKIKLPAAISQARFSNRR